ncbi:transposase [Streptomyces sp. NPDC038707]|uniref:transposase n=1 Tax=unclassified Streptomyces TaxID=2593676 RepID=UPI0034007242
MGVIPADRSSGRGHTSAGRGRRRAGDREALAAIIFVAASGCAWRQLPPVSGPAWPMVHRRFAQWSRDRVRAGLHRVIHDAPGG